MGGKVDVGTIESIFREIDNAPYATSDPTTIMAAVEAGLCGEKTGSMALGFNDDEHIQARQDHAARAIRILAAQQKGGTFGSQVTGATRRDPAEERLTGSESTNLSVIGEMNSDAGRGECPTCRQILVPASRRRRPDAKRHSSLRRPHLLRRGQTQPDIGNSSMWEVKETSPSQDLKYGHVAVGTTPVPLTALTLKLVRGLLPRKPGRQ